MKLFNHKKRKIFVFLFLLFFLNLLLESAQIKLKVVIDNARVKKTPELAGETITRLPLNTILTAEEKQGEWYKVNTVIDGNRITGYIFEPYVEVVKEEEAISEVGTIPKPARVQAEIVVGIESKIDDAKKSIRDEKNPDKAIMILRPLVARVFRVTDNARQRELATEIYYWLGLASVAENDDFAALMEFRNMFEIDHAYAKDITRNLIDEKVVGLIKQAEDIFQGKQIEYAIDIVTDPSGAKVKINGEEKGVSPLTYKVKSEIGPVKFDLLLEKEGYKPVNEEIMLMGPHVKKNYALQPLGRDLELVSVPEGATIYLDGQDTGEVTNSTLPKVKLGRHTIKVEKKNYQLWQEEVEVSPGQGPFRIEIELTARGYKSLAVYGGPESPFLDLPKGIAIDKNNNIYVIDESRSKVRKLNAEFRPQTGWSLRGRESKNLKDPTGIAVDSEGNIYITDQRNHNVMKFDSSGEFLTKWGQMGQGDDDFNTPQGIAVDSDNNVYIADTRNHRIKKYSSQGALKKIWGKRGNEEGDLLYPADIAINNRNEVYVVDRNRVTKFSSEGEFISAWGSPGQGDGEFMIPMGISVDTENNIYVADSNNHRIQKFDEDGNFIIKWGTSGVGEGELNFPAGIAVDSRGYVFVVERDNNRIQAFGIVSD